MSSIPRREIGELFAKYDFHANIFDIYVEGDFDFDFFNFFLEESFIKNVSIFHINDIQVGSAIVEENGFNIGSNKSRVLTLARLLDLRYGSRPTNITCIVDADCDRILGKDHDLHHVLMTDYSCLESYLLAPPTLRRFLTFACQLTDKSPNEFSSLARAILPAQFALRAVVEQLKINQSIIKFESGLINKKDLFSFCSKKYIDAYISRYALQSRKLEILETFNRTLGSLPEDIRHSTQGHDFISLLFEYLWSNNALKLHDKTESMQRFGGRLVAIACRLPDLVIEPLFSKITESASGSATMRP